MNYNKINATMKVLDPLPTRVLMMQKKIKQKEIAIRLNAKQPQISEALNGKEPKLLERVIEAVKEIIAERENA
jgi:predicted XRE-type DNA-binding protein